jgi:hypothetical protein
MTKKETRSITLTKADLRRLRRYQRARDRLVAIHDTGDNEEVENAGLLVDVAAVDVAAFLSARAFGRKVYE